VHSTVRSILASGDLLRIATGQRPWSASLRGKVAVSVTVHYTARYQLPGQGWITLAGTVDITGPATALTVAEARPVLVEPER
jgi:hypothetical protein